MKKNSIRIMLSIIFMSHVAMHAHPGSGCGGHHHTNPDIYKTYVAPLVVKGQELVQLTYDNGLLFYNDNKELVHTSAIITAVVGMAYLLYRSTCSVESSCKRCKKKTDDNN